MKKILFNKVIFLLLIVMLSGCKTDEETSANRVQLFNIKDEAIITIIDSEKLNSLLESWHKREQVILKKMPVFDYKLIIAEDGRISHWSYSSQGYVTSSDKINSPIFRVKLAILNEVLENKPSK